MEDTRTWSPQQNAIFAWFEKTHMLTMETAWEIDVNGHLIARARAGTGKTTVIIEGVKRAPERSILICAFSKIIQEELDKRIGKKYPHIQARTLHSVGLSCVRRFRSDIKISFDDIRAASLTAKVCGTKAPDAVMRLVTKLHTKGREIAPHARNLGDLTDIAITFECIPDQNWANSGFPLEYVETKALEAMELAANVQSGETIDGSDMIFLPVRNGWLTGMWDLVVVDEAQDMTTAQLEIAQGVLKEGGRIAIIGDNRQAIFGFRGADSESLDRLKSELNAGELGLTITYRCGKRIVDLAQAIVPDFQAGPDNPEGEVRSLHTSKLVAEAAAGDFILSRVNAPLVSTAMKLLLSGKRTKIAGKDIGKGLISLVRRFKARSIPEYLSRVEAWANKETSRLTVQFEETKMAGRKNTIMAKMEAIADQAEMLTSVAAGKKNVTEVERQIEDLFTDDGLGAAGVITCSSVHRAKGLEADKVFVLQDTLRGYNIEEQNIEYVAITRAKRTLVMVSNTVFLDKVV